MKCPVDQSEMHKRIYEADIEVDECPTCLGIWLDRGELHAIEQSRENDYTEELKNKAPIHRIHTVQTPEQTNRNLSCPSCGDVMYEKEHGYFSKVMIDTCINCRGVWLDRGELKALEIFFEKNKPIKEMTFWGALTAGLQDLFN